MKVQVRRIDAASMAEVGALHRAVADGDRASAWAIEDIGPAEPESTSRISGDRWLCLGIAVLAAVTGFGFMGRLDGDVRPADEPSASAAVADRAPSPSPASSTEAMPATAPVHAPRSRRGGDDREHVGRRRGHREPPAGDAAPGSPRRSRRAWRDGRRGHQTRSGPCRAIPIFAPPVRVQVELVATVDGLVGRGFGAVRRSLWLDAGGPLGLWPARVLRSHGHRSSPYPARLRSPSVG